MSEQPPLDVLAVGRLDGGPVAAALDDDGVVGHSVEPTAAGDVDASAIADVDCVVACTDSLPTALVSTCARLDVPVVDGTAAVDGDNLRARIRAVAADEDDGDRDRVTQLHAASTELVGASDRETLYDRILDIAEGALGFDVAVLFLRREDRFERVATTDPDAPESLPVGHGLTDHVYEADEPELVDDIEAHPVADYRPGDLPPEAFRSGLVVPFGDQGVLEALSTATGAYDERDLELAELLATHAAQVDARLRAEADLQARQAKITRLHEAATELIDAEGEQELYDLTVDIARGVLEFDRSTLLVEATDGEGGFVPVASTGSNPPERAPNDGILGRTYETGEPQLVVDARSNEVAEPSLASTRSAISVPFGDDGVFQVLSTEPAAFDEDDVELLELLSSYAAATRERVRSANAARESRRRIEALLEAAADVAAAESEQTVVDRTIEAAEEVISLTSCVVVLREDDVLVPVAESEESPPGGARRMHVTEGLAGKTHQTGDSFLIDRVKDEDDAKPVRDDYRSAISVPIGDLGVFQATATSESMFDEEDLNLAELLMTHVAVALERVRAQRELRSQRDRLEALFENIPGAAISYEMRDGEPVVRRVNAAFERTFGYDEETVRDESLDDYIVPADDSDRAAQYNEQLERGERIQAEVERLTADGSRHFLLQVIPLEVGAENSSGYAIYTDVTEQREREAELRRQNERLDQFASVVSHDLRNPLSVASGYLEMAQETGDIEKLDRVERALDRMDELVNDLLTLAREGRDVGEPEPVALAEVTDRAWANVATDGATLAVETDATVAADPDRLTELFENLFRNAVEHAGPSPTVTVSDLREDGAWVGFRVADDGPGIDGDVDPFETGATTSEAGTGFGLPIVRSIAEAHGWSVSLCDDAPGACFAFRVSDGDV